MNCKKCGQEVDAKAVVCTGCGCKIKKPFYKKIWFWIVAVLIIGLIGSATGGNDNSSTTSENIAEKEQVEITYEVMDLQTMYDDLEANAMKAESKYQDKNTEIKCRIASFDSDGGYIAVEPVGADEWNFTTSTCNIKNNEQKEFLLEKNVGDVITIKGKIKSIGELMGYTIDIDEVY